MNKKQKQNLIRILVTAVIMVGLHFADVQGLPRFLCYMVPYLIIGYDILIKAVKGVINRQAFDECLLMSIATVGAMALAVYEDGDYTEGIAVMLFYQIGEWFQSYAVGKSRRSISDLMDIRPDYANIERNGKLERVDPDEIEIGTIITVQPGERVPIDGVITDGKSVLDTSALTGESMPRRVEVGDDVASGCVNVSGLLRIRTTKEFGESTASKVLDLVENASSRKSKSEAFISRFARVYTPAVVLSALALAVFLPLVLLLRGAPALWGEWFYRALTFLVISCPCALVISIPLSFFAGLGGASREGILVKGSNYLETLSRTQTVAFDKTGTLTRGVFEVTAVHPELINAVNLLHLAAHVEQYSTHPIAASLRRAYSQHLCEQKHELEFEQEKHETTFVADGCTVDDVQEIAGQGVWARVNGQVVCVGNPRMMERVGAKWHECSSHKAHSGTVIHVAIDGEYAGHVLISDIMKPTAKEAITALKATGINRTVMLTGDSYGVASSVALELGIVLNDVKSGLLPDDKVAAIEELLTERHGRGSVAFVGDGINDAPVLSRADIGIAMGAMGSEAAIEAADVVLMDDDPLKIAKAIKIARKCMDIVYENIVFAIGVKLLCLLLGALGWTNMWFAIFADVGVMILAVLNAIRALFVRKL